VVKDAFSENGSGLPPAADGSIPQTQSESAQAPAANLTELAQLLAASIAQSQAGKGRTGIPTNADLTSLANLVSAAQGQRTLAPVFKDGLSSLSYSQARPAQGAAQAPLDIGHHHDDEPMPIPSTWRQPMAHDEEGWMRQQMGAAFVGLLAGLAIVVPTVLWLSGVFDSGKVKVAGSARTSSPPVGTVTLDAKAAADASESRTVKVQVRPVERSEPPAPQSAAQYVTGSVDAKPPVPASVPVLRPVTPPQPVPAAHSAAVASVVATATTAARLVEPSTRLEELLTQVRQRVESGDVGGARELLSNAEEGSQGAAVFALAETYDPNMLAAWGTRGVAADVAKARALYRKALSLGAERAQIRLDALK
jgi:hypothetical protein